MSTPDDRDALATAITAALDARHHAGIALGRGDDDAGEQLDAALAAAWEMWRMFYGLPPSKDAS